MPVLGKYLLRKVVYAACGVGTVAAGAYLTGHTDISEWTIKGLTGAIVSGVWGALLSGVLGGALAKQ